MIFGLIIGRDAYNRFEDRKQLGVTVINKSTRLRRIWVRQFYIRSGKAHPPAHIEICVGGCNAVDGHKDKQDVELFFTVGPKQPRVDEQGASGLWRGYI